MDGAVVLPYKVSTLLFCFNEADDVLLLLRTREPNRGLWSPCGGKLKTEVGESPFACACREAQEELGVHLQPADLHLTGLVSESGYGGSAHWLMFLFEVRRRFAGVPPAIAEGQFAFHSPAALGGLAVPQTDREQIWPLFWRHRGGFFSAHCRCLDGGRHEWVLEDSRPSGRLAKP